MVVDVKGLCVGLQESQQRDFQAPKLCVPTALKPDLPFAVSQGGELVHNVVIGILLRLSSVPSCRSG